MKLVVIAFLSLLLAGCEGPRRVRICTEMPTVNLPISLRQTNWWGNRGEGSCVWATTVSLLRWVGQYAAAERIKQYGNGAGPTTLGKALDLEGIRYAETTDGDASFLERACRTRRGCGICCDDGDHVVALVYIDAHRACVLDNNDVEHYHWMTREELISDWKKSGGWAFCLVYSPAAPLPQRGMR